MGVVSLNEFSGDVGEIHISKRMFMMGSARSSESHKGIHKEKTEQVDEQ